MIERILLDPIAPDYTRLNSEPQNFGMELIGVDSSN
jgi:hypothetical protein